MAQYRVLAKSFINGKIVDEGDIVEYDGEIASNLEPVKGKGKATKAEPEQEPEQQNDPLV
jgi:hypothetical protein